MAAGGLKNTESQIFDSLTELHDGASASTSTGAGQVDAAAKILDTGSSNADVYGTLVVDVSAIVINDDDEDYTIVLEGSDSASFASGIEELAELHLGANEILAGDVDSTIGRYTVPIKKSQRSGRNYRYLRVRHIIAGTTPSITYTAFLTA